MTYLDNGATTLHKPAEVTRAVQQAMQRLANPGRGGYPAAMDAAQAVFRCRRTAGAFFGCPPERVVFTSNCTHGLNLAIHSLVRPGARVAVSGFEHNAVVRPLYALGTQLTVAGRRLFDWEELLDSWEQALRNGQDAAVFTHVSNVFGYILPVERMAQLCRQYGVPFILDAAQSAGSRRVNLQELGAAYIAMPGHKGLLGPQGTGLLLCGAEPQPLLYGGTGSMSASREMPDFLPDRLEAGTLNVPGICGLEAGIRWIRRLGLETVAAREEREVRRAARGLQAMGIRTFSGAHQGGTLSFLPPAGDCEQGAEAMGRRGVALRAGLHCAPVAHESAGTLETGTIRLSFGPDAAPAQTERFLQAARQVFAAKR